jgi:hypothetical protein
MQNQKTVTMSLATVLTNGVVVHDSYWPTGFSFWGSDVHRLAVFKDGSQPTPEYLSNWDSDRSHDWESDSLEYFVLRSYEIVGEEVLMHFVHQDFIDDEMCEPA